MSVCVLEDGWFCVNAEYAKALSPQPHTTWKNGTEFYHYDSSGWCVQGGFSTADTTTNLYVELREPCFNIYGAYEFSLGGYYNVFFTNHTTKSFIGHVHNDYVGGEMFRWVCFGVKK